MNGYKKYASEAYVDEQIDNCTQYVDERIENHTHDEYASIEYVDEKIASGGVGGGVTQEYVDEQIENHTHDEYASIEYADEKYASIEYVDGRIENHVQSVEKGGTGYTSITDTTYTTARYRASSLHPAETTPTTNGVIAWTYE